MAKTLTEYIEQVSVDFFNMRKTSVVKDVNGFEYLHKLIIEDYINILKANAIDITLTDKEVLKYRFKPRLLSKMIYGSENLFYLLLVLNDTTVENFVPRNIYVLSKDGREIIENIINKERSQGNI